MIAYFSFFSLSPQQDTYVHLNCMLFTNIDVPRYSVTLFVHLEYRRSEMSSMEVIQEYCRVSRNNICVFCQRNLASIKCNHNGYELCFKGGDSRM